MMVKEKDEREGDGGGGGGRKVLCNYEAELRRLTGPLLRENFHSMCSAAHLLLLSDQAPSSKREDSHLQ